MTAPSFGDRLAAEFAAGRHLCAGIDPHAPLLAEWGFDDSAESAERMGREVVAAATGVAACVKPQVSFYERFGSAGFAALERVLADARDAGLMVVADVKRGDIGSTFAAYAEAWLSPGSPLESDAMTVAPYMGFGTLDGAFPFVREHGKGLFVLAATSNPEAAAVQTAVGGDGRTLAASIIDEAERFNREHQPGAEAGSIGVVLGATLDLGAFGIDTGARAEGAPESAPESASSEGEPPEGAPPLDAGAELFAAPALPVLAPGFGHQGARIERAGEIFGTLGRALLANESRSILGGGADGLAARIAARAEAIAEALAR